MGILDNQLYYYFRLRNGVEYAIKVTAIKINTAIMHTMYRELTTEQREFYLANPTASVQEVVNCQLTPTYVPPAPELQGYIEQKLNELKNECYAAVSVTSLEYAMANAVLAGTSLTYTGEKYYSTNDAKAVMKQFMDESYHAMTVYDTYSAQIEVASSIDAVDTLYNQAITAL